MSSITQEQAEKLKVIGNGIVHVPTDENYLPSVTDAIKWIRKNKHLHVSIEPDKIRGDVLGWIICLKWTNNFNVTYNQFMPMEVDICESADYDVAEAYGLDSALNFLLKISNG